MINECLHLMVKLNLPKGRTIISFANPFKRIGAFIIDMLILNIIVISPFSSFFEKMIPEKDSISTVYLLLSKNTGMINQTLFVLITITILMILYFTYLEYKFSQSIGKMIFKIHVESSHSKELTFYQCLLRNLYLLPIFPFILLWIIDPIMMLIKGRRLSEIFSKTKTVEVYPL